MTRLTKLAPIQPQSGGSTAVVLYTGPSRRVASEDGGEQLRLRYASHVNVRERRSTYTALSTILKTNGEEYLLRLLKKTNSAHTPRLVSIDMGHRTVWQNAALAAASSMQLQLQPQPHVVASCSEARLAPGLELPCDARLIVVCDDDEIKVGEAAI